MRGRPIEIPAGWMRYCPTCRADVVAFRDHDLTCMFCDGATIDGTESWHGTEGGYSNHRCRCDKCRAARQAANRDRYRKNGRRKKPTSPPRPGAHGTRGCYVYFDCRCARCRAANSEYQRRRARVA